MVADFPARGPATTKLVTARPLPLVTIPYDSDDVIRTRDTKYKLIQHHCCYDLRKFTFTDRVLPIWNSLSNHVVSADTVDCFKNRSDKLWSNQEVLYNHKADLHGTGNSSVLDGNFVILKFYRKVYFSDTQACQGLCIVSSM